MNENTLKENEKVEVKQQANVIVLPKPIEWEGETITELKLDFDQLTGDDILMVEGEFMDFIAGVKNVFIYYKNEHPGYHAVLAAKAAGVHPNVMKKLKAKEFLKVSGAAKLFLKGLA
ncbi:phage tail assembly protein [Paenibacillus provencensis]|uniref:Phage tail assembly protein n=1 Tax=Paenibacillus provencensis TaxID=441151 RepID=A0ABW3PTM5_9BACL|nr:phage tail assembly protein [Paenibacillus sp. MER 78]MCM3129017.1 phage tail assembly protein [Paenibacillus sp. MER 78]